MIFVDFLTEFTINLIYRIMTSLSSSLAGGHYHLPLPPASSSLSLLSSALPSPLPPRLISRAALTSSYANKILRLVPCAKAKRRQSPSLPSEIDGPKILTKEKTKTNWMAHIHPENKKTKFCYNKLYVIFSLIKFNKEVKILKKIYKTFYGTRLMSILL